MYGLGNHTLTHTHTHTHGQRCCWTVRHVTTKHRGSCTQMGGDRSQVCLWHCLCPNNIDENWTELVIGFLDLYASADSPWDWPIVVFGFLYFTLLQDWIFLENKSSGKGFPPVLILWKVVGIIIHLFSFGKSCLKGCFRQWSLLRTRSKYYWWWLISFFWPCGVIRQGRFAVLGQFSTWDKKTSKHNLSLVVLITISFRCCSPSTWYAV